MPEMTTNVAMAKLIGQALKDEGLSQADFCRLADVSTKHLCQVLKGHATAAPETLDTWAWLLGRKFEVSLEKADGTNSPVFPRPRTRRTNSLSRKMEAIHP